MKRIIPIKAFLLIIIIAICGFETLTAEYIVYKTNNSPSPITDSNEYNKIYDILMNYQWPMVIGTASKLPPSELQELSASTENAEENFLRKKLQAISSNYDIAYVPTIIYELFVINQSRKNSSKELQELQEYMKKNPQASVDVATIKTLIENPSNSVQNLYDLFRKTNNLIITQNAHRAINNLLVEFINKIDPSAKDLKIILKNKQLDLAKLIVDEIHFDNSDPFKYLNEANVLDTFINFENEVKQRNAGVFYRAGSTKKIYMVGHTKSSTQLKEPIDISFLTSIGQPDFTLENLKELYAKSEKSATFTPWKLGKPTGSISYGNSLLAGSLNDIDACAGYYYSLKDKLGYALFINKKQLLSGNLKSLFIYSSLNTLASLFGEFAFFHSRTVSYASEETPLALIPGIGLEMAAPLPFDRAGILLRIGNPIEQAYDLSDYITHNAQILKLPNGTFNVFKPTAPEVSTYYQAQEEATQLFKAMSTLKKSLSKATLQPELRKQLFANLTRTLKANTADAFLAFKKYLNSNPAILKIAELELIKGVIENNNKLVEAFLKAGVSPNAEVNSVTALMSAAALENNTTLDLLIKAGANLNKLDEDENTALSIATSLGNYNQAEKLLKAGANPNIFINKKSFTPLDLARGMEFTSGSTKFQTLLEQYNAKIGHELLPSILIKKFDNKTGRGILFIQEPYLNTQLQNGINEFTPALSITLDPDAASKEKYKASVIFRDEQTQEDLLVMDVSKTYPIINNPNIKKVITNIRLLQIMPGNHKKELQSYSKELIVMPKEDVETELSIILDGNKLEASSMDIRETVKHII